MVSTCTIGEELGIVRDDKGLDSAKSGEAFMVVNFILLKDLEPWAMERIGLGWFPKEGTSQGFSRRQGIELGCGAAFEQSVLYIIDGCTANRAAWSD